MNKESFPLKVLHTADIQIEVRNQHQRADEYRFILEHLYQELKTHQSNLYFIVGDIFETCRPNDIEREIFIEHLKKVVQLPELKEIVITYGNHDVDQRQEFNYFLNGGEKTPAPNSLDTIVAAIASSKIMLLDRSTVYRSNAYPSLVYYNWSQKTKHSGILDEHYNPLDNNLPHIDNAPCKITFYHDPIYGCTSFDGKTLPSNEKLSRLDIFKTKTIFAGDIHQPQMINDKDKIFIYPGSPCPRNYGEGDYYDNGRLIQEGAVNHTFLMCLLNEDGTIVNQEWKQVPQYRTYATFTITNDVVPSDVDKLNWNIEHSGTNETFVKVKLPSASESWLVNQQHIIDLLKDANSNLVLNISFVYGKGITTDNETSQDVDVKELISRDKIIEVAKKYIHNQVTASRSIPSEDKEKVEKEINDIFLSELDEISSVRNSNVITLNSMKIINFMSFGKKTEIDFSSAQGITKLTGGNGVGKTTLYKALKWVLTGYISQNQNRTKKNENNLAVFNDYLYEEPIVEVSLNVTVNEKKYYIVRNVERTWKKGVGVEEKASKNWKQYIASTDMIIHIYDEDGNLIDDSLPAEIKLQTWFGGLENLERIVFADQFTLKSFVCSESQRLCEEILNHMGLSFFDTMAGNYDKVRSERLSKLGKPSLTIEQLNTKITDTRSEIEKDIQVIDERQSEIGRLQNLMKERREQIEELSCRKYPGITQESVDLKFNNIGVLEKDIADAEKDVEESKKELEEYFASHSKEKLEAEQKSIEDNISNIQLLISETSKEVSELRVKKSEYETKKSERIAELKLGMSEKREQLMNSIADIEKVISSIDLKISELSNKKSELLFNKKNELENTKIKLQSKLQQVQAIKTQQDEALADLKRQLEELNNSEVCPTCGRRLDEHTIEQIQSKIFTVEEKIGHVDIVIKNCEHKIIEISEEIKNVENSIASIDEHPEHVEGYSETTELIQKAEQLKQTKTKSKDDISGEMSKLLDNLNEEINSDETIKNINLEIENTVKKIDELDSDIALKHTEIQEETSKLESAKNNIKDYTSKMEKKMSLSDVLLKIQSDKTKLENLRAEYQDDLEALTTNTHIDININAYKKEIEELESQLRIKEDDLNNIKLAKASKEEHIETWKLDINNVIRYRIVESSLKQYKTLLGKSGLPQYIFSIIKNSMNEKLNDLLEDLNFRLLFNENNELVMLDLTKTTSPMRYPSQFSGMQTCFSGLSLLYVNRMCNVSFIFDTLFIDEISGQLNSGEDLQYESLNYQEQLKALLRKFEGMNIWIVDHVIRDMNEEHLFEVSPSTKGTQLTKLR